MEQPNPCNEETGGNEHAERDRSGLKGNTDHEEDTSADGKTTTETIRNAWGERKTTNTTNTHNGIEQPEETTAGVVEVILPVLNHLGTVHHRAVHITC